MQSQPKHLWTWAVSSMLLLACTTWGQSSQPKLDLEAGFRQPPDETKPWVYWYWISDHISKEGITRDLETMAQVGIGEALIGNVDVNEHARGNVKVLTEEWWGMVEHAVREGGRLGVNIGLFNCPGWSQSGGPWIKPEQTMRYLTQSETRVKGPAKFNGPLPAPRDVFQDVAVLAMPAPAHDADNIAGRSPRVTCQPQVVDAAKLLDGRPDSVCLFPADTAKSPFTVDIIAAGPFTARSLLLHPASMPFAVSCQLQAMDEAGSFRTLSQFTLDRSNPSPATGFMPYAPLAISFPAASASHFRLVFTEMRNQGGLAEIELLGAARLERFIEKQLGKMCPTPFPNWGTYLWPASPPLDAEHLAVQPDKVVDLTSRMSADGTLQWEVPEGEWIILRAGMTPTGVKNAPASPEGTGLEVDKMSRQAAAMHFDAYIGQLLRRMPPAERKALRRVVADSYEMGGQSWTDGLAATFHKRYGYDPLPWLPVLTGRVVGSPERSDRFLWDLRRLIADCVATEYVGGLREQCEKHDLRLWLENYGHWGFPGEFLQYGGQSHDVSGEFWESGDLGLIELRAASTAVHTYGKGITYAEAFTSGGPHWTMDPWWIKRRGDWACTEGINRFVLHVYIHQPYEDRIPGINAPFGTEFNRHNTWFKQSGPWIDYLRRTHFLLQQGRYVADVLYFIGEDTPKMTGARKPELPPGYSFDYVNAEVIEQRMQVKDGRFVLPDGMAYRLLILPELTTMRPAVARKLREMVNAGGAVLGPPPSCSPSMENYPACDQEVRQVADELWATGDDNAIGQGRVFRNIDVQTALKRLDVEPDITGLDAKHFLWLHRTTDEGEIYFISNQHTEPVTATASFRVKGLTPEVWDAVTAKHRELPVFEQQDDRTIVPLKLTGRQSLFVVFRKPASGDGKGKTNFPAFKTLHTLTGPWEVRFDPRWGGPETIAFEQLDDWSKRPEEGIKYYSGSATYYTTFDLPTVREGRRIYLDLGEVKNIARIRLNEIDMGMIWAAPRRVDITGFGKASGNMLEVQVTNTWANRIIGDAKLPAEKRLTWTVHPHHNADSPLLPAGLLGPVTLQSEAD